MTWNGYLTYNQARHFAKKTKAKKAEKSNKEKEQVREEFAEVDTDDIMNQFKDTLGEVIEILEDELKSIKSGRATGDVFDDLEVKAYGEWQPFGSLCQTIVRGNQLLTVKVFDESVKDEVVKTLARCDMDIDVQLEGKDIRVKMGLGKKEHAQQAIQKIKVYGDESKVTLRQARKEILDTSKKLVKILPKDVLKQFEDQIDKELKKAEKLSDEMQRKKQMEIEKA